MLIKLSGGKVFDPANKVNGRKRDIFIRDGWIVTSPGGAKPDKVYDVAGKVVMAGAIDLHSHIAGGKGNISRMLLPEEHREFQAKRSRLTRSGSGEPTMTSFATGYRYAEMGYTAAFEPAMVPVNARQAHLEMADVPIIDKGAYVMLGNDDFFLRMLAGKTDHKAITDYVAWTMGATQALGVKVVNPGGISAFKFNHRMLDLDQADSHYGLTPRGILHSLTRALTDLGVPHPLHVHGCNLGVPGNVKTTLKTMAGSGGRPLHLTHIQFHAYGAEGDRRFSSGAARIAEAINTQKNITVDVGQIMFGQTVTASGDNMTQHRNADLASPHKWVCMDIDCQAGCGVVPFRYRERSFVNALQWAIGLEIFLLVNDPWRIFLTTDHPNGAPFTSYPHLIRLLMDRSFRNSMLDTLNKDAAAVSTLRSIKREYSLYDIAVMTRAAPARILGLKNRGHLGPDAAADITVYTEHANKERMFEKPDYVFKDGELVVRRGKITNVTWGATHVVRPEYHPGIEKKLKSHFENYQGMSMENFVIRESDFPNDGRFRAQTHKCGKGRRA